jgi:hypothetical protein
MNSLLAFARGEAARRAGAKQRVFDWIKAADLIAANPSATYYAGLSGDLEHTGGCIWRDGKPVFQYTYLSSCWAAPVLYSDDESEVVCETGEESGFTSDSKWPDEALRKLGVDPLALVRDES